MNLPLMWTQSRLLTDLRCLQWLCSYECVHVCSCSSSNVASATPCVGLVRKLISLLEAVEKLPVYTHDPPGQVLNLQVKELTQYAIEVKLYTLRLEFHYAVPSLPSFLQVIHRRLRFSLERAPGAVDLLDCSKRTLRIEPLVSVEGLEKFLNGMVSRDT